MKTQFWGILLGLVSVFFPPIFAGLSLKLLVQISAACIVLGGVFSALLIAFDWHEILMAFGEAKNIFFRTEQKNFKTYYDACVQQSIEVAQIARKEGILALDGMREKLLNPFFADSVKFVIDGIDAKSVSEILQTKIKNELEQKTRASSVFDLAGTLSPAVGILGAVLGLIPVLGSLSTEPASGGAASIDLGSGIASAFIAIVYGLFLANLVFIPLAEKIRSETEKKIKTIELALVSISGIQEGLSPQVLKEKLLASKS